MLLIHYNDGRVAEWTTKSSKEETDKIRKSAFFARAVTASAEELDYIEEHFSGIPKCSVTIVNWFSETAMFIVGNL